MASKLDREIAAKKQRIAELEAELEEHTKELSILHMGYGFKTLEEFIEELRSGGASTKRSEERKKRANITPEMRSAVQTMVTGGRTNIEIAGQLGISGGSVQNIKKQLGLVRAYA